MQMIYRSPLGPLAQLVSQIQRRAEVAVDQVPVSLQSERRRVVPHPALQPQRTEAGLDEHRGARVSQCVKPDAGQAGVHGGGDEHAPAQAALSDGLPLRPAKTYASSVASCAR